MARTAPFALAFTLGVGAAACVGDRNDDRDAGGDARRWTVHSPGVIDPRSSEWHGKVLRDARWAPMLDANNPNACGRCHDGTLSRPSIVSLAAPGATDCRTCHSEPEGVLACGTCHGAMRSGAHAAHVEPSASRATGLACSTCHPSPSATAGRDVIGGLHGNGAVEIVFDSALVAPEASYERSTGVCSVACHNRGGARGRVAWTDTSRMRCGDCHGSPPAQHFPGACVACHREADATGTVLSKGSLHLNGRVDLGDGSGACGACHGAGEDPWPTSGAHAPHKTPTLTTPVECANCHVVPTAVLAQGHLDGVARVSFAGRATDRGARPTWNGATCSSVACHGAELADTATVVPAWSDTTGAASACGACHGTPPAQHTTSPSCDRSTCHGTEVSVSSSGFAITASGKSLHINGLIEPAR